MSKVFIVIIGVCVAVIVLAITGKKWINGYFSGSDTHRYSC